MRVSSMVASIVSRLGLAMVVTASSVTALVQDEASAQVARPTPLRWSAPVEGAIVAEFREPSHRYGPGHRGLDFAAEPSTPVQVAGAGVVIFAGRIGEAEYVTVDHGDGVVTTYSYLAEVSVARGERVRRGQTVGASGAMGSGHEGAVVHFGLRVDGAYRDPRLLLRRIVPADVVRLDTELG